MDRDSHRVILVIFNKLRQFHLRKWAIHVAINLFIARYDTWLSIEIRKLIDGTHGLDFFKISNDAIYWTFKFRLNHWVVVLNHLRCLESSHALKICGLRIITRA